VFVNPRPDAPAALLIDRLSLKGLRIGTAEVSEKHANFIQSDDGGRAADVPRSWPRCGRRVEAHTGIRLRSEVRLVGFGADAPGLRARHRVRGGPPMSVSAPPEADRTRHQAPMDPRVRARRIAVAKAEGRRRLHRVLGVVVVALTILTGWAVLHSPLVSVQHVQVEGPRATVGAGGRGGRRPPAGSAAGVARPREVAAGVATLAPVGRVQVTKRWPRTVRITVVERLPLLAAGTGRRHDRSRRCHGAHHRRRASSPERVSSASRGPRRWVRSGPPPRRGEPRHQRSGRHPAVAGRPDRGGPLDADGSAAIGLLGDRTAVFGSAAAVPEQFVALATVLAADGLPEGATVDLRVPRAPVVVPDGCIPGQGACSP
jgi:hypothetical protein